MVKDMLHTVDVNRVAASANLRDQEKLSLLVTTVTRRAMQRLVKPAAGQR